MSKQITQLLIEGLLTMAKNIDEFQTSQLTTKPGYPNVPTHTQLAKDHDDHPLHDLSAQCAEVLALRIGKRVFEHRNAGRKGAAPVADLMRIAKGYIFHPAKDQVGADAEVLGLRKEILDLIESWAKAPANQAGLKRLETASWPIEQNGRSKKSIEEIRTRFAPYQKLAQATLQAERVASRTQECLECVV